MSLFMPTTQGTFLPTQGYPSESNAVVAASSGEMNRWGSHSLGNGSEPGYLVWGYSPAGIYGAPGSDDPSAPPRSSILKVFAEITVYAIRGVSITWDPFTYFDWSVNGGASYNNFATGDALTPITHSGDITGSLGSIATFDFTQLKIKARNDSSLNLSDTPPGWQLFITSVGLRVTYNANAAVAPWIVNVDPLAITVSDLDGGSDLADLVFNIQDEQRLLTSDFPNVTLEGKQVKLLLGFVGLPISDYLTLFTGRINSVASDNANLEYKFTCPDIRKDMSKVIFALGDDGFATSSDHPKTLNGHPLDLFIYILETELGYAASDIDIAGITQWRDTIFSGLQFTFAITSPPAAKDFIENEIMKPLGAYHFTNNLGIIKIHFFYPIAPASVATLDHSIIEDVPLAGQADLVDQVTFRFDADTSGKFFAESLQSYGPSIAKYGLFGEQVIESLGMRSAFQGYFNSVITARLIFLRYGSKQLLIDGLPALWQYLVLEPGDIVSLTTTLAPDRVAGTLGISGKTFEILDRTWDFIAGVASFRLLEIDLSKFRQFLITPNAQADYAADTALNQAKYLYLCNSSDQYSTGAPGNTLC